MCVCVWGGGVGRCLVFALSPHWLLCVVAKVFLKGQVSISGTEGQSDFCRQYKL